MEVLKSSPSKRLHTRRGCYCFPFSRPADLCGTLKRLLRPVIREAFDFANFGEPGTSQAFLDLETGKTYCHSDFLDDAELEEPLPDDLESDKYVQLPYKRDLDLGRRLAFRFVNERLPDCFDKVRQIFSRRGAYSGFKDLLDRRGKLDDWYAYEEAETGRALREWCRDNDIEVRG